MRARCVCLFLLFVSLGAGVLSAAADDNTPRLTASPDFLFFRQTGTATLPSMSVKIAASNATLNAFTVAAATRSGGSWLSATPLSGTGPTTLSVSVNTTGLAAGEYAGSVTVTAAGFSNPLVIGVLLEVGASGQISLAVRPDELEFEAVAGGSAPPAQSIVIISPFAAAAS